MELKVKFNAAGLVAEKQVQDVGLGLVDRARQEVGLPDLPLDVFKSFISSNNKFDVTIEIDEKTARESGLFREENKVQILVPEKSLTKYFELNPKITRTKRGKTERVKFFWKLKKGYILADWIEAGYPTEWNINGGFDDGEE